MRNDKYAARRAQTARDFARVWFAAYTQHDILQLSGDQIQECLDAADRLMPTQIWLEDVAERSRLSEREDDLRMTLARENADG